MVYDWRGVVGVGGVNGAALHRRVRTAQGEKVRSEWGAILGKRQMVRLVRSEDAVGRQILPVLQGAPEGAFQAQPQREPDQPAGGELQSNQVMIRVVHHATRRPVFGSPATGPRRGIANAPASKRGTPTDSTRVLGGPREYG